MHAPDFNYNTSRNMPANGLPIFMDNIHTRSMLNTISRKTLETNHFNEGGFQSVLSSFNLSKNISSFAPPNATLSGSSKVQPSQKMRRVVSQGGGVTLNHLLSRNGYLRDDREQAE